MLRRKSQKSVSNPNFLLSYLLNGPQKFKIECKIPEWLGNIVDALVSSFEVWRYSSLKQPPICQELLAGAARRSRSLLLSVCTSSAHSLARWTKGLQVRNIYIARKRNNFSVLTLAASLTFHPRGTRNRSTTKLEFEFLLTYQTIQKVSF